MAEGLPDANYRGQTGTGRLLVMLASLAVVLAVMDALDLLAWGGRLLFQAVLVVLMLLLFYRIVFFVAGGLTNHLTRRSWRDADGE